MAPTRSLRCSSTSSMAPRLVRACARPVPRSSTARHAMASPETPTTTTTRTLSREERKRQRMEENTNFAVENDGFKSTADQRAICAASFGLTALCVGESLSSASSVADVPELALSALAAYVLSDLGSGVFHWSVDNYGSGKTPILGNVIAAFQGHHSEPWTITMREFSNNTYKTCIPTIPFLVLCAADVDHPQWQMFWSLFSAFICLAQQFHAWSHMSKQEIPKPVAALQDAKLVITRQAHSMHHRAPFENNYCIVSGLCNPALDGSGVLQWAEERIFEATGVKPRCWLSEEELKSSV